MLRSFTLAALVAQCFFSICYGMCDQRAFGGEMKCCDGKDSHCFVKVDGNRTRGQTDAICYCDSYCKFTNDCCEDFDKIHRLCKGARDCRVSEWEAWGDCSTECGFGVMKRKRKIVEHPANGGKTCPSLRQTRGCNMYSKCDNQKHQTAFILPIAFRRQPFGMFLYENILPVRNDNLDERNEPTTSYCVHYKVTYKRYSCENTWAGILQNHVPVCTECQSRVMDGGRCRGEGTLGVRTRWKALGLNRCHGHWIRLGPIIPNCTCNEKQFSNFVFV